MKFERLVIECKNFQERDSVFSVLDNIGFKGFGNFKNRKDLFVHTYDDGDYVTYIDATNHKNSKRMSFDEFMVKHSNQFHDKIKQAMSDFGLNREELSMKLGYSAPYITKMLTLPQSEKVKKKVVEKIDNLYQPKQSIGKLVVDLEQSPEFKKVIAETKAEIEKVAEENKQLEKELEHKNQVLDKRNDLLKDAEYEITCLNDTIKNMQIVLNERTDEIDGLSDHIDSLQNILNERMVEVVDKRIAELERLNKQLGIDLSKRNKDVRLLNFGCVVLCLIVLVMAYFW